MKFQSNIMSIPKSRRRYAKRPMRTAAGSGIVELCAALIVGVPLFLACTDLGLVAFGAYINDTVCKEAARAAASGPPANTVASTAHSVSQNEAPYERAVAVIVSHLPTQIPIAVSDQPELTETLRDVPTSDVGGSIDGDISVKTNAVIFPPFILASYFGPGGVRLSSRHTDAYSYILPRQPEQP